MDISVDKARRIFSFVGGGGSTVHFAGIDRIRSRIYDFCHCKIAILTTVDEEGTYRVVYCFEAIAEQKT